MRIVHISDIHIRNFKYHREYEETFDELYACLDRLKPDIVINTGDTVHSKTQITPEMVDMLGRHIQGVSSYAPYRIILGNHDLNLKNTDRMDAISPVVKSLQGSYDVCLWDRNEKNVFVDPGGSGTVFNFWVFSLRDEDGWPTQADWSGQAGINIGLFHGAIKGCSTDLDWVMDDSEHDVQMFSGLDFVMMGDIHRHQTWNGGRIAYAGSLIQQNFGETPDKGFLVWDIEDRDKFSVTHHRLKTSLRFCTVPVGLDLVVPEGLDIPAESYLKVVVDGSFTPTEQRQIADSARRAYRPKDVFVVGNRAGAQVEHTALSGKLTDFSSPEAQENILRDLLDAQEIDDDTIEAIVNLDREISKEVQSDDDVTIGSQWTVNKIGWSNLFQYGDGNIIDFDKVRGVYGVFGQNGVGKSSIFETITEGLFDRVTKDVPKNIDLINDNRDEAKIVVDLSVGDRDYVIERTISRIKYGQRKKDVKEWGKTSLDFYEVGKNSERSLLNGSTRPETEKSIRRLIGSFEDFCLISMTPQMSVMGLPGGGDFINCKDTDRKKLLYRFLGLDIFERKAVLAKEKGKELFFTLKNIRDDVEDPAAISNEIDQISSEILERKRHLESLAEAYDQEVSKREELKARANILKQSLSTRDSGSISHDIESVLKSIASIDSDCNLTKELLAQIEHEITRISGEIDRHISLYGDVVDVSPQLSKVNDELSAAQVALGKLNERSKNIGKKILILQEVPCGDQFPNCKFLRDAFEAKDLEGKISSEISQLEDIRARLQSKRDDLKEKLSRWKERTGLESDAASLKVKRGELLLRQSSNETLLVQKNDLLKTLEKELEVSLQHNESIIELNEIEEKLDDKRKLELLKAKMSEISSEIMRYERYVGSLESKLIAAKTKTEMVERLSALCRIHKLYTEAMGKNGIPRIILMSVLPQISREVNRIITSVSNMTVSFESGDDDQSLSLAVMLDGKSRPIALMGGAQKFIVSLAIRAALARITNLPRSNMFIIDEGFGRLDPENMHAINRMFQFLRGMFDHIIIVSHTEVMRDMVDGTIDIGVDDDGMAHVEHI